MLLDEAQKYLDVVRKRGTAKAGLKRVYENICKHTGLFVLAYGKLYANTGALTPGVDVADTIDGMSLKRIEQTIEKLREDTYRWETDQKNVYPKETREETSVGNPRMGG